MDRHIYELMAVTFVINLIDTLAYSIRLNSVKSKQFALSTSLFNVIALVSRTANTLQGPLIGGLIDYSIVTHSDPIDEIRKVILASTVGTMAGIALIPTFLKIFSKAVERLELEGSVPSIVIQALSISNIKRMAKSATIPTWEMISSIRFRGIPKRLLILNVVITGVYTVGVLSAYYSATMVAPQYRLSVSASSGLINGVASILLSLFIDPKSAIITDQAMRGDRPYTDVKALVILLIGTKLAGTLLGQALIIPSAEVIAYFYR